MTASEAPVYRGKSGRICLDFANTMEWHASQSPQETLRTYADLAVWARRVGLLTGQEARKLINDAEADPARAGRILRRAIELREAVYRIFVATIRGETPAEPDLAELNRSLGEISNGAAIKKIPGGFEWEWKMDRTSLDGPIGSVALSAAQLMVSPEIGRVGQCADERGCGWLFLDTSRNHSRRWCDSKDCGNRERQHRHYQRTRGRS
jgi:predicted RNA-binding Zn ribbon-like protein